MAEHSEAKGKKKDTETTAEDKLSKYECNVPDKLILSPGYGIRVYNAIWSSKSSGEPVEKFVTLAEISKTASQQMYTRSRNEARILSKLDHKRIIKIFESFECNDKLYMSFTPVLQGGSLKDRMERALKRKKTFSELTAWSILKQLVDAIAFLDRKKIAHRNISPEAVGFVVSDAENIMLVNTDSITEIEDGESRTEPIGGYTSFMSPEMIEAALPTRKQERLSLKNIGYGRKTDVWSVGCVAYYLFIGRSAFKMRDIAQAGASLDARDEIYKKYEGLFKDSIWGDFSLKGKKYVQRLLTIDPAKRPSGTEAFEDEYIQRDSPPDKIDREEDGHGAVNAIGRLVRRNLGRSNQGNPSKTETSSKTLPDKQDKSGLRAKKKEKKSQKVTKPTGSRVVAGKSTRAADKKPEQAKA